MSGKEIAGTMQLLKTFKSLKTGSNLLDNKLITKEQMKLQIF
jgi:hypothetical protein